jgi:hypothetical protein
MEPYAEGALTLSAHPRLHDRPGTIQRQRERRDTLYERLGNDESRLRRQHAASNNRRSMSSISISNITEATPSSTVDS